MAREAERELQERVHRHRLDEGLRALRELVIMRRDAVNAVWMDASGDELLQYQGEAQALRRVLRFMDEQPIKQGE